MTETKKLARKFMLTRGIGRKYHTLELTDYYGSYQKPSSLWKLFPSLSKKQAIEELHDAQEIYKTINYYLEHLSTALKKGKGLFFYGKSGTGKSLLMNCIAKEAMLQRKRVRVISAYRIIDEFAKSWANDSVVDFEDRILRVPLLCIEEMNKEFFNSLTIPTMTKVIKYREANNKATCFTCNEDMEVISSKYSTAIASSLKSMCKPLLFDSRIDWRDVEQENWEKDLAD